MQPEMAMRPIPVISTIPTTQPAEKIRMSLMDGLQFGDGIALLAEIMGDCIAELEAIHE